MRILDDESIEAIDRFLARHRDVHISTNKDKILIFDATKKKIHEQPKMEGGRAKRSQVVEK